MPDGGSGSGVVGFVMMTPTAGGTITVQVDEIRSVEEIVQTPKRRLVHLQGRTIQVNETAAQLRDRMARALQGLMVER